MMIQSPPTILPGRDNVQPGQSYRTPQVVIMTSMEQWCNGDYQEKN
jgi:hypothetical protein